MSAPAASRPARADAPPLVVVALGSNLGDSARIVRAAIERLREVAAGELRCSSLWRTSPVDCPDGSPGFINAVVAFPVGAGETPEALLARMQELEREFGRRPKVRLNEPRPLDLDLIAFGSEVRSAPGLTLPHPRAHQRRFVLVPLAEILPDFVLPGQAQTVAAALAALATGEVIERLDGV